MKAVFSEKMLDRLRKVEPRALREANKRRASRFVHRGTCLASRDALR